MNKIIKTFKLKTLYQTISFFGFVFLVSCNFEGWKTASRDSANLAPKAQDYKEAIVQVYAAKVYGWRGHFADHTWISTKKANADSYTVYQVIGWRKLSPKFNSVVRIEEDLPDRLWFGNKPKILIELRGDSAKPIIDKIHTAATQYPYPDEYDILGPNSNTFTQWISCRIPELNLKLPFRAIGKNYLKNCEHEPYNQSHVKLNMKKIK